MNVNNRADAHAVAAAAQADARALQAADREARTTLSPKRGIDPSAAYAASLAAADGQGYVPELAQAWADAETAAFEAAFAGWARWPEGATLGVW